MSHISYMSHIGIESLCTSWREGIWRIWQVPYSALIPGLCDMPLLDMFYASFSLA